MFGEPFSLRGGVGKYSGKIKREHEGIKTDVGFCEGMENYYDLDNPVVSSRKEALKVAIKQIYIENFK